ncbi:MAG: response regulator transcription factor [Ilumatobacteraceae bacterium]
MPQVRVLVVEDEENIAYLLRTALSSAGYEVTAAATGSAAVTAAVERPPDVMVVDVMLPDFDGFEVARRVRNSGISAPILFLSARGSVEDKVRGLTIGGDDYVTKPFALEELMARIAVHVRRVGLGTQTVLRVADLVLDDAAHRVWRGDVEVHLSATEYTLLRYLMRNCGRVMTRAQILDHVWQYDFGGDGSIIETFVSNLRKKLDRGEVRLIHTIRGVGYAMREPR